MQQTGKQHHVIRKRLNDKLNNTEKLDETQQKKPKQQTNRQTIHTQTADKTTT